MPSLPTLCRWYSTGHPTGPRVRGAGEVVGLDRRLHRAATIQETHTRRHNGRDGAVPTRVAWLSADRAARRQGLAWDAEKIGAPLVAIGAFLAKFGVVLLKFKFLFSMFVSAAFYVWLGGWWFGIGLIV